MSFVFLSHRSSDKPRLRDFVLGLIDRGVPVWVDNYEEFNLGLAPDERRIESGELAGGIEKLGDWPTLIDHALVQACAIVVFWSKGWDLDRAILMREHGAAHIYANAKKSSYIPVFLDAPGELPQSVLDYRVAVNDTVQGYDVSRYGDRHWQDLTDKLVELMHAATRFELDASNVQVHLGDIYWDHEIRSPQKDPDRIVSLLMRLPPGPAVDPFLLEYRVRSRIANSLSPEESISVVMEAGGLVLRTFSPDLRKNPDNLIVMPAATPSPYHGTRLDFWLTVFDHSCNLGPRMLGALLLSIRPQAFGGNESAIVEVMQNLENAS